MPDLRIPGIPARPGTLDTVLRDWFGYNPVIKNQEFVLLDDDAAIRSGPPPILQMHPRIELDGNDDKRVARAMVAAVPAGFEQYAREARRSLPQKLTIAGGLGLLSEVSQALIETLICEQNELEPALCRRLLPLLHGKLGLKYIVPISVDAERQQSYVSLGKTCLLSAQYGGEHARRLILEEDATSGIQASGLDVLNFVDALTRLCPIPFTLPVKYNGCAWHFYGDGFLNLPSLATQSLFSQFFGNLAPRSSSSDMIGLRGISGMGEQNIWRFLRFIVGGLNDLLRYVNDPRSFVNESSEIDFLQQLQAYGALHLLFADLLALNYTTSSHVRITISFAFLDKLANLRRNIGQIDRTEGSVFSSLLSLSQGREAKRLVTQTTSAIDPSLALLLTRMIGRSYWRLHRHLGRELPISNRQEESRLNRMRSLRNLLHGTYLYGDQFGDLFLRSKGTIPDELASIPFALTLALISNPLEFLQFNPHQ